LVRVLLHCFMQRHRGWLTVPDVVSGCETWSGTLRDERRLRMVENRVMRKIFGAKRDEVKDRWK